MYRRIINYFVFGLFFICLISSHIEASQKFDIMLVLDNSGSMKKNDPNYLAKKSVLEFIKTLSEDTRLGILIFADKPEITLPLVSPKETDFSTNLEKSLIKLDYRGRFTDIPGAVERAMYELKQKGRPDAVKAIILMTDGMVDLGDSSKNKERTMWLKEVLLDEAKQNKIYVFGIAFTEEADYALIQTIAQRAEGNYYRALKPEELQSVFERLRGDLLKKTQITETKPSVSHSREYIVWIILAVVFLIGIFIVLRRRTSGQYLSKKEEETTDRVPESYFKSDDIRIEPINHRITKTQTLIGRTPTVDVQIDRPTISRIHARIIYENGAFYLIDNGSSNGTLLKNTELKPFEKYRLYGGEEIFLDKANKFKFLFVIPGVSPTQMEHTETIIAEQTVLTGKGSINQKDLDKNLREEGKDNTWTTPDKK